MGLLKEAISKLNSANEKQNTEEYLLSNANFVKWFSEINKASMNEVGCKAANLSEMYNSGFPVPVGFVVTAEAISHFIEQNKLKNKINEILVKTNANDPEILEKDASEIQKLIDSAKIPRGIEEAILDAYEVLDVDKKIYEKSNTKTSALDILRTGHEMPFVAVRCSSISEKKFSLAGQHDSLLFMKGKDKLLESVKSVLGSFFSARAIYYQSKNNMGFNLDSLGSIIIQKMIDSDKAGVVFSRNPLRDDKNILIESVFGLGKGVVSGKITADSYLVNQDFNLLDKKIANKKAAFVRDSSGKIDDVALTEERGRQESLTGYEIKMLSQYASRLEEHFNFPVNLEFAIENGKIFFTQARPITTDIKISEGEIAGDVLFSGFGFSGGIGCGNVRVLSDLNAQSLKKVRQGDVLVLKNQSPDATVSLNKVSGIIAEQGSALSHGSIVSREFNIPVVVASNKEMQKLKEGQKVTVDGFSGKIVDGEGIAGDKKYKIDKVVPTRMKMKIVVNTPEHTEKAVETGIKEIGLVKLEKIIKESGRHANWYLKNKKLDDFISLVYRNLKKISVHFDKIWIRTTSLRSDEHKELEDSPGTEKNPLLGNHGIRFSLKNRDLLEAELKSIKELADEYPEKKIGILLPKVISVNEVKETKKIIKEISLPGNVKLGIMIETPAAVQIINQLCEEGIDFVNLGLSDLTQYVLAVDKENKEINDLHNEMDPAILNSVKYVLERCRKYGVETSVFADLKDRKKAEFFVNEEVESVAVEVEDAKEVSEIIADIEKNLENKDEKKERAIEKNIDQEDLILKALDEEKADEYVPGEINLRDNDIPDLNEAIPVASGVFELEKEEKVENIGEIFETRQEEILDRDIEREAEEFEEYQKMQEEGKKRKGQGSEIEDEALDIF